MLKYVLHYWPHLFKNICFSSQPQKKEVWRNIQVTAPLNGDPTMSLRPSTHRSTTCLGVVTIHWVDEAHYPHMLLVPAYLTLNLLPAILLTPILWSLKKPSPTRTTTPSPNLLAVSNQQISSLPLRMAAPYHGSPRTSSTSTTKP